VLPLGATVNTSVVEFRPDGTSYEVVANVAQPIAAALTLTVTRKGKTKAMTINGSGKIQYQQ
jgi:hypothetical protein